MHGQQNIKFLNISSIQSDLRIKYGLYWDNKKLNFTDKIYSILYEPNIDDTFPHTPLPAAARSKAKFYGRSPAEIVRSNPTGGMDVSLLCAFCVVR
jgi:hypothetical protein